MKNVLVFDVNGTLLDLNVLDEPFVRLFGRASARQEWFGILQSLWMTDLLTNTYHSFDKLAQAALRMTVERWQVQPSTAGESVLSKLTYAAADTLGIDIPSEDESAILEGLKNLPPFPDVSSGLDALQRAGFRLVALSNGTRASTEQLLQKAGLADYFESVLSVETIKRFKPAPEAYQFAADQLGVPLNQICLVAAHAWDIAGASSVGCQTTFLQRPNQVLNPEGPKPDWLAADLVQLARQLR